VQEEGPFSLTPNRRTVRLTRVLRPDDSTNGDERISPRRVVFWVAVWVGILIGIVFYFKYARLLTPLLG
jgi:hypothetical protein